MLFEVYSFLIDDETMHWSVLKHLPTKRQPDWIDRDDTSKFQYTRERSSVLSNRAYME